MERVIIEWISEKLDISREIAIIVIGIATILVWYVSFVAYGFFFPPSGESKALRVKVPFPKEADPEWADGEILENPGTKVHDPNYPLEITCFDPATGRLLGRRKAATKQQVLDAVAKSREAQLKFRESSWQKRRDILTTLLEVIVRDQEGICRLSSRVTGKTGKMIENSATKKENEKLMNLLFLPALDATFGEIIPTCEKLIWTIRHGEKALKPEYRESGAISFLAQARVQYSPIGVMGLIVSWNYPIHNVISPLTSAIMAGNGCVIKVSENAGWATQWLSDLVAKVLEVHEVDTDLVSFLDGTADAGEALVQSVTFIGSPAVGKLVMRGASETLTPVVLELGGKDAAIVFDDCEYENMIKICMRGGLQNCGQNCAGLERMIVQEGIYERVVQDVTKIVSSIRLGTPFEKKVDLGAICMKSQIKIVQSLLADAVSKGAKIECGGEVYNHPLYPQGQFFRPTVLTGVDPSMRIHHEEVFGPVILIYKFSRPTEAIKLINSTDFGLGSSIFTLNYRKAEAVARYVNAGSCNINGWGFSYLCQSLPFGGVKHSGFDRFGGIEGLRGNCNIKAMTTDKLGHLGIRAQVPSILHFPIKEESVDFQAALIEILYGVGFTKQVRGVKRLNKFLGDVASESITIPMYFAADISESSKTIDMTDDDMCCDYASSFEVSVEIEVGLKDNIYATTQVKIV
ncbi:hypothetical protein HK100_000207 [Physocladia obscura]|uniref:Aldehyde dehydrogenase domain-containing protein n=1 Tax=Physocladia obscura TaxID=109957 RepID=A0AAD5SYT7_9FUNG|nr:hypothetical protein HK100_000207 [Physocladia obscura]